MNSKHARLLAAAIRYDRGDARRIQHFVKVHDLAAAIGALEGLDVGGYSEAQIERVKYLIARHHTYSDIDGVDYQILVEADFLVNLFESPDRYGPAAKVGERIFRTAAGKRLLDDMFVAGAYHPLTS